jgi:hypothetical protein
MAKTKHPATVEHILTLLKLLQTETAQAMGVVQDEPTTHAMITRIWDDLEIARTYLERRLRQPDRRRR